MKKVLKILGLLLLIAGLGAASYYLYTQGYMNYLIVTGPVTLILVLILINFILNNRSEEALYKSKVRQILKTYDSVLVKSKNLPKLDAKNIIRVDTIEDLVDAQMEIRKPIYYQEQTESCAFVLLDNNEACIFIIKKNDQVMSPVEITLNEIDIKNRAEENKETLPDEVLKDIERTTIVRVNKNKYVKVSPIRSKKVKEDEEKEVQQEEIKAEDIKPTDEVKEIETPKEEKVQVEEQQIQNEIKEEVTSQVEEIAPEAVEEKVEETVPEEISVNNQEEAQNEEIQPEEIEQNNAQEIIEEQNSQLIEVPEEETQEEPKEENKVKVEILDF